jgi:hypothetical protein
MWTSGLLFQKAKVEINFPLYSTLLHFSSLLLKTSYFLFATYCLPDIYRDIFFLILSEELIWDLMLYPTTLYALPAMKLSRGCFSTIPDAPDK